MAIEHELTPANAIETGHARLSDPLIRARAVVARWPPDQDHFDFNGKKRSVAPRLPFT
jgi:hypothetical protein